MTYLQMSPSSPNQQRHVFLRLLQMNSPEWITILIGCIASLASGAIQPIFAVLLTKIVMVSLIDRFESR
jgi:ABC-type multidrug transport system permease subunit